MRSSPNPKSKSLSTTYPALLTQVRRTLIEGQQRIEAEKVRTYWETGRLIREHILQNKDRAEYGAEVLKRLAKDLGVHISLLERCAQFARTYPRSRIFAPGRKFTWSHYRVLMAVPDERKREQWEEKVSRHDWSRDELILRVRSDRPAETSRQEEPQRAPGKPLVPMRGQLYTYKLIQRPTLGVDTAQRPLLLDLGFGIFRDVDSRTAGRFEPEAVVESRPREDAYALYASERGARDLYTYRAFIEKVVDGDTLKARIDLGFETWTRQVLRLRGIDCPEIDTKAGDTSRAFVQSLLKEAAEIVIRSSRSDKYDRYLADVFIPGEKEIYLNNLLLEQGHAVIV